MEKVGLERKIKKDAPGLGQVITTTNGDYDYLGQSF